MAIVDDIMAWENGEMDLEQECTFFAGLVKSGMAWTLQGMYGRQAARLIEAGLITRQGETVPEAIAEAMGCDA